MRVQYTDTALDEIDKIMVHIARENPIAAAEVAVVSATPQLERE
jgi:plasmid stabilization system protein ParE